MYEICTHSFIELEDSTRRKPMSPMSIEKEDLNADARGGCN